MKNPERRTLPAWPLRAACVLAAMLAMNANLAHATEIIPSVGVTKSTDTNAGDAQGFGGLAIRAPLFPFLAVEGAVYYRQDSYAGGDLKVRQWPVTASLWALPVPNVYAGAGVGWYRTTYDWRSDLPFMDVTNEKLGVHVGGGVVIPLAPKLGLDLNGRYIFLSKTTDSVDVPTTFNPDFWTLGAGLAIKF